jgi:hypothetical protein
MHCCTKILVKCLIICEGDVSATLQKVLLGDSTLYCKMFDSGSGLSNSGT